MFQVPGSKWTKKETQFLEKNYEAMTDNALAARLPGRTTRAVALKRGRLFGPREFWNGIQVPNELGNRYGRLIVSERAGCDKTGRALWLCICDCGEIATVAGARLRYADGTKSCGCLARENGVGGANRLPLGIGAMRQVIARYRARAKERGYEWNVTEKEFYELSQQPCHYCGVPPSNVYSRSDSNGDFIYNSLDRKDSLGGYVLENIVPCCRLCNTKKSNTAYGEFLAWVRQVYEHQGLVRKNGVGKSHSVLIQARPGLARP